MTRSCTKIACIRDTTASVQLTAISAERAMPSQVGSQGIRQLRGLLAGDCPRLSATNLYERCDVHNPTLSALLGQPPKLI